LQGKPFYRRVDGVLLLDKPSGLSSNAALQRARRAYGALRAGHTGTLDPMASGLLPLCFGEATKLSGELLNAGKGYLADIHLGVRTSTGDAEGDILESSNPAVSREQFLAVMQGFRGEQMQTPPMHSALKRNGQPLYALARRGETVAREARQIVIYAIDLLAFDGTVATVSVDCSKGTYIRVLAEDIGAALGCGGHLSALRRTRVGSFSLDGAIPLHKVEDDAYASQRDSWLLPLDLLAANRPRVELSIPDAERFGHGQTISPVTASCGPVRVYAPDGRFLGLGQIADSVLKVQRGLQPPGV